MPTFQIVILALSVFATHAAVLRNAEDNGKHLEMETTTIMAAVMEGTTVQHEEDNTTTLAPEVEIDESETISEIGALTEGEEASILLFDDALLDSSDPAELRQIDVETVQVPRAGKLLLLSTPKLGEKAKVPEALLDESEELEDLDAEQTSTHMPAETTTIENSAKEEAKEEVAAAVPMTVKETAKEQVHATKLFPINDTLYESSKKADVIKGEQVDLSKAVLAEEPKEMRNSNLAAVTLEEEEHDYFLIDSDFVEEGPYADIDSDLRLQPIVQSVEIVPSSVDDRLLVNYEYVHRW